MTICLSANFSGGASLGSFHAGAAAALVVGLQESQRQARGEVVLGGLGGASAGAFVALVASQCVLRGFDPVETLHQAWVEDVSIELLVKHGRFRAPLTLERLRDSIHRLVSQEPGPDDIRSDTSVGLCIALTALQGQHYPVNLPRGEIIGTTYADLARFDLRGGSDEVFSGDPSVFDCVLASASHPGAFAPRHLRRPRGLVPGSGAAREAADGFWFTDGGLLQSAPVGDVVRTALDRCDAQTQRQVHWFVDPRSGGPSGDRQWSDPNHAPSWTDALARALSIIPEQAPYDDMRRIADDLARADAVEELAQALSPHLTDEGQSVLDDYARRHEVATDTAPSLQKVLLHASGLRRGPKLELRVASPLALADPEGAVPALLAGNVLGDFGGFLARRLRHSDFLLGYDAMSKSLEAEPAVFCDAALHAIEKKRIAPWHEANMGSMRVSDLTIKERMSVFSLGVRVGGTLFGDVLRGLISRQ